MGFLEIICNVEWALNLVALLGLVGVSIGAVIRNHAIRVGREVGITYPIIAVGWVLLTAFLLVLDLFRVC